MSTQILRPNGVGAETNIAGQYPTSGEHWDKVDEATPDDSVTYVRHNLTSFATDTYALPAGGGVGDIDKVTVYARCYGISGNYNYAKTVIRTHSTLYEGTEHNLTSGWENLSTEYQLNPNTSQPWTWAEIGALEAGVALKSSSSGEFFAICTQVYVEVSYHTETPKSSADTGSGAETSAQTACLTETEAGSGAGVAVQAANFVRQEGGSAAEGLSFLACLLGSEVGSAIEKVGGRKIVLDETGEGIEAASAEGALASAGDLGGGAEAIETRGLISAETGVGISIIQSLITSHQTVDSGAGSDGLISLLAAIAGGDSGAGFPLSSTVAALLAAAESGSGIEQLLARRLATSQGGSGIDSLSDLWKGTGDKAMVRGDNGSGAELVHDRVIFLPDTGLATEAIIGRALFAREGYGHALSFDGGTDRVDFGSKTWSLTKISVECWFKPPVVENYGYIFWKQSGAYVMGLMHHTLKRVLWALQGANNTIYYKMVDGVVIPNAKNFLMATQDGNTVKMYANGSYIGGATFTTSPSEHTGAGNMRLANDLAGNNLGGIIAEVRVSDSIRTLSEHQANWNGGKGKKFELDEHTVGLWHIDEGSGDTIYDETDNHNDGTIYGAGWVEGFGFPHSVEAGSLLGALTEAEAGSGADAVIGLITALGGTQTGSGIEALVSRLVQQSDSGLGVDTTLALLASLLRSDNGAGTEARLALLASLLKSDSGISTEGLLSRLLAASDWGSTIEASLSLKACLATDSGLGADALAKLLAGIIAGEGGSGYDRFKAKVEAAYRGGDMRLPPSGQIAIPSRKVQT